jgi:hypothetical protein
LQQSTARRAPLLLICHRECVFVIDSKRFSAFSTSPGCVTLSAGQTLIPSRVSGAARCRLQNPLSISVPATSLTADPRGRMCARRRVFAKAGPPSMCGRTVSDGQRKPCEWRPSSRRPQNRGTPDCYGSDVPPSPGGPARPSIFIVRSVIRQMGAACLALRAPRGTRCGYKPVTGARRAYSSRRPPMKNLNWFDAVTLLLISLMSIVTGVAGHAG